MSGWAKRNALALLRGAPVAWPRHRCHDAQFVGGVDLREADLSGCRLAGARLDRADLSRARLAEATLDRASLIGADVERG